RFGTSTDEILALNKLSSPDELSVGQIILIPGVPPPDLPSPNVVPRNPAGAGFIFPIEGACLPNVDKLMPNAPREYRAGIHDGVVTRYCHLSAIPTAIRDGTQVAAGDLVGYVGDSGTPEAVTAPGTEIHLHFELRVGDTFLGAGLPTGQVRQLYEQAFSPP